jgi:pyruvate,orthophosphate dikinase
MQDIEFTVEEGKLFLLQTRSAKRTAAAALKAPSSMVDEGLITREEAVARIDPAARPAAAPADRPERELEVAAQGLNASPGAACGAVVFDADTAASAAARARRSSSSAGRRRRTTSTG